MTTLSFFSHWLNDPTVREQYNFMIIIIAIAKSLFGVTMVTRDIRKGGPEWPLHWNMLVGIWIMSNGAFFWAAFFRLFYQADLIYLLRTLQIATIMTLWVAVRWLFADKDGNPR